MKQAIITELFDHAEGLLARVVDLKREGYEENDMYVVVKRKETGEAVRRQSNLYVFVADDPDAVASLVTSSERPVERWLGSMRLTPERQETFAQAIEYGKLFLYVDSEQSERITPERPSERGEANARDEQKLLLHEEQLEIEKRAVQTGELIIDKRVTESNQEIEIPVRREQLHVERKDGSLEELEDYDFDQPGIRTIDEGDHLRIQVIEERAFIVKRPVVVEEIIVHKRVREDVETVTETLRKEEVDVRQVGDADIDVDSSLTKQEDERI
ncbi:YsnF/AvaK domain-containing protein [Exiguobacterium alkaliphilum]|uniref:YsnF/AvaK domain-containing protein n=1 Tax=Exiguobacterium alkaliphilum TaxID=1428684 RepID=UPI00403ACEA5